MAKDVAVKSKPKKDKKSSGRILRYFKDLRSEIKKVVWPSKKQVRNNTLVVLGFMAIAGVFIWILDGILGFLITLVFG